MRVSPSSLLGVALLFAAASGCATPPSQEIAAAEAAFEQARKDGAAAYAPERFREAQAALETARRRVAEKDYRGALSSATEAAERSRSASQQAGAARTVAQSTAQVKRAEVEAALEDVDAVRSQAVEEKVPDEAFAELAALEQEIRQGLAPIGLALDAGQFLEAQQLATELKARAAGLSERYREALEAWKAAHPKRGRAPRRK